MDSCRSARLRILETALRRFSFMLSTRQCSPARTYAASVWRRVVRLLREVISKLLDTIRFSETFDASPLELMAAVRSNGLEGVVAKRRDGSALPSLHCSVRTEVAR